MFSDFQAADGQGRPATAEQPSAGEGAVGRAVGPKGDMLTAGFVVVRTHEAGRSLMVALPATASPGRRVSARTSGVRLKDKGE
jgi:hypothetical protein